MAETQRNARSASKVIEDKDYVFTGTVDFTGATTGISRTELDEDSLAVYTLKPEDWRKFDDMDAILPTTPLSDDLGLVHGTFGTNSPTLQTEDHKANGAATANKARITFALPPEYVSGGTITIRAHCGMKTTIADQAATIDFSCYASDEEEGISADLVTTAATAMNSVTLADKDFAVTATGRAAGDLLDIQVTTSVDDDATGTAVIGLIGAVKILLDVKG